MELNRPNNNPPSQGVRSQFVGMMHASQCKQTEGQCKVVQNCADLKLQWNHVQSCQDTQCNQNYCISVRHLKSHFSKCRLDQCANCQPLRKDLKTLAFKSRRIEMREARKNQHSQTIPAKTVFPLPFDIAKTVSAETSENAVRNTLRERIQNMAMQSLSNDESMVPPGGPQSFSEQIANKLEAKIFERANTRSHLSISDLELSAAIAVLFNDSESNLESDDLEIAMRQLNIG